MKKTINNCIKKKCSEQSLTVVLYFITKQKNLFQIVFDKKKSIIKILNRENRLFLSEIGALLEELIACAEVKKYIIVRPIASTLHSIHCAHSI